jgi:hypothetical protein
MQNRDYTDLAGGALLVSVGFFFMVRGTRASA